IATLQDSGISAVRRHGVGLPSNRPHVTQHASQILWSILRSQDSRRRSINVPARVLRLADDAKIVSHAAEKSGIPSHPAQLALARFPFNPRKNARGYFDQAWSQLENGERRPSLPFSRAKPTLIEAVRHPGVGKVLHNHFGEIVEDLHLGG